MLTKQEINDIADEYYLSVLSYCRSHLSLNEHEAEDITQDVFLLLQEKSEELENTNMRAWLYAVARNKAKEFYRINNREKSYLRLDDEEIPYDEVLKVFDEYFPVTDDEINKHVKIILKTLNDKETILFKKVFMEKKTYKQVAEEMGLTETAVNSRAFRLRKKITTEAKLMATVVGQIIIKIFF